jgi:hypothetical protein
MVNRILVGAHYGLKDWIIQRATAIIMAVYTVIFLVVIGSVGPDSLEAWRGVFANGFMRLRPSFSSSAFSTTPGSASGISGWTTSSRMAYACC